MHHDQHDASADGKSTTKMPKLSFKRKKDAIQGNGKRKQASDDDIDSAIMEAAVSRPSEQVINIKQEPTTSWDEQFSGVAPSTTPKSATTKSNSAAANPVKCTMNGN